MAKFYNIDKRACVKYKEIIGFKLDNLLELCAFNVKGLNQLDT
jgi:hypothetical protein